MDSIRELIVLAIDALGRLLTTGNVSLVDLLAIGQFAVLIFLVAWVASLLTKLKLVLGGLLAVSFLSTMGLVVVGQFV